MECKFIKHGIALSYDQVLTPCCEWRMSDQWSSTHHLSQVDIVNWHNHKDVTETKNQLLAGQWPKSCHKCEHYENSGRFDSIRGNGNRAYADYADNDITLEIRPGSTCNFACQTCWPEASSRVAQYHHQAGFIDIKNLNSNRLENFDFLLPVAHRIRNVVLLGGEPFYDKSCKKFLHWANQHLTATLVMFTNGSVVDFDFLKSYPGKIVLVFSLDAVGRPAEYIRHGTVWDNVLNNYQLVKDLPNVELRVNITCSVYNYFYLSEVIELLCQDWPAVVTFGTTNKLHLNESAVPTSARPMITSKLLNSIKLIQQTNIESGQKSNAVNAIGSIVHNLHTQPWNTTEFEKLQTIVSKLDEVKNLYVSDYCDFLAEMLQQKIT
jgi:wyosine [tRNA(Phe)-imidazoG37] synthetase (radical SAM superfamily)